MKDNFVAKHNKHRASTHRDRKVEVKKRGWVEYYVCPYCDGEGVDVDLDFRSFRCYHCGGSGEIIVEGE